MTARELTHWAPSAHRRSCLRSAAASRSVEATRGGPASCLSQARTCGGGSPSATGLGHWGREPECGCGLRLGADGLVSLRAVVRGAARARGRCRSVGVGGRCRSLPRRVERNPAGVSVAHAAGPRARAAALLVGQGSEAGGTAHVCGPIAGRAIRGCRVGEVAGDPDQRRWVRGARDASPPCARRSARDSAGPGPRRDRPAVGCTCRAASRDAVGPRAARPRRFDRR